MKNEVELVDASSVEVVLYDKALFPELRWQDPQEANARFVARFNQAETLDDLYNVLSGANTQGLIGRKFQILDVDFVAYQADDGIIPNALCLGADLDSGEVLQFATTSGQPTMFLGRARLLGLLPAEEGKERVLVKITETKTRSGNTAINFDRP